MTIISVEPKLVIAVVREAARRLQASPSNACLATCLWLIADAVVGDDNPMAENLFALALEPEPMTAGTMDRDTAGL